MRHLLWSAAALSAAALLGCAGGSSSPVSPPSASSSSTPSGALPTSVLNTPAALGTPSQAGLVQTAALALYTVTVDPSTLTATSALKATRAGQANDDLYLLSIDSFLNAKSFQVTGVSATGTTIDVEYVVKHPFPAPNNITGTPNGSTNRADLGISGMALFLVDVPTATGHTYFTDRVLNHDLVANADAYFSPGGLLTTSGTANTFPYRQLVDELADARLGVSNGGDVTGNFGSDGWTRSEFGPANDGWTGYGVLHQGQAAANTVSFNKGAIGGGFSLDVAMIAVYNDPRGGATPAQKKANRLPPASPDASLFAYRMPHGALDVHRVRLESQDGLFYADTISAVDFSFYVEDWDARATETTEADLATDPSFTNVAQGESGVPTLDICIPGILGDATVTAPIGTVIDDDTSSGGDPGEDSGRPGDAIFMTGLVTKPAGSGQVPNNYVGVVRAADAASGLLIGLDENLAPLAVTPASVTYQAFTVPLFAFNAPPSATVALTSGATLLSGTQAGVSITGIADADSDPLDISVDWGDGLGFVTVVSGLNSPYPAQTPSSPNMNNLDLTPDPIDVIVRLDDGTDQVDYPLSYTLGPNRPPQVTGTRALASASLPTPATFTMNAGTGTATDPEGDTISYTIVNNRNSDTLTFSAFPNAANTTPIANPPHATVTFTVYANDALHPTTSGTAYPTVNGTITGGGPSGWVWSPNTQTTSAESARGVAVSSAGNIYLIGAFAANTNWGGGPLNSAATPRNSIVALDSSGTYLWDRNLGSLSGTWVDTQGIGADSAGNVIVYGYWRQTMDFGFGPETNNTSVLSSNYDTFVCKYSATGTPIWNARSSGPGTSSGITDFQEFNGLAVDQATGDVVITGKFNRTEDWGSVTLTSAGGPTSTSQDPYVVRISSAGVALWGQSFNGPATGNESAMAAAFTPSGNVAVGGYYRNLMDFGGGVRNADTSGDGFVVMLNGTTGAHVWDYVFDGTGAANLEYVNAVAADGSRVYATGRFFNTTDFGGGVRTAGGSTTVSDPFVVALNSTTGAYVWDRTFTGSTSSEQGRGVAVTASGVVATGDWFTGADFGGGAQTPVGGSDLYVIKMNPSTGATIWLSLLGSTGTDSGRSIGLTAGEDPIIVGSYSTTMDFDAGPGTTNFTSVGSSDAFATKFLGSSGTIF
ncbi:MAG: hypothetical protein GEEBNDBF_00859 [bacterium]|nr:hypothetical protein [bacterium]